MGSWSGQQTLGHFGIVPVILEQGDQSGLCWAGVLATSASEQGDDPRVPLTPQRPGKCKEGLLLCQGLAHNMSHGQSLGRGTTTQARPREEVVATGTAVSTGLAISGMATARAVPEPRHRCAIGVSVQSAPVTASSRGTRHLLRGGTGDQGCLWHPTPPAIVVMGQVSSPVNGRW